MDPDISFVVTAISALSIGVSALTEVMTGKAILNKSKLDFYFQGLASAAHFASYRLG